MPSNFFVEEGAELVLKKRRKKKPEDIDSRIEEIEKIIEEEPSDSEEIKKLLKRIDAIVEVLLKAATEEDEEDVLLAEIKSGLDELKDSIAEVKPDVEPLVKALEEKFDKLEEVLTSRIAREIRNLHDEELLYLSDIKKSLDEMRRTLEEERKREEERLEILEKEISLIKDVVGHINKVLDADVSQRKESLKELKKRLTSLEEELKRIAQEVESPEHVERINNLHEELKKTKDSILYAISKLEDMEARDLELVEHALEEVKGEITSIMEHISEMEKRAEVDETRLSALEEGVNKITKRMKALLRLSTKNTKILEKYAGELADIIAVTSSLEAKLKELKEMEERQAELMEEYVSNLFKRVDESLADLLSKLRDLVLENMRKREKSVDAHINALKNELANIHSELGNLLVLLKQYDVTSELKEIEEHLKTLSERVEKGIMDKGEIREQLEIIEKRLDIIEKALPTKDLEALKASLKKVEESLSSMESRINRAGAIISHDDLKQIIRDLEEVRVHARLLKDSGVVTAMEELHRKVEEFKKTIESLPEETLHVSEDLEHLEELIKEVAEIASQVEEIAKSKAESADKLAEYAETIGRSAGVVGSHLVRKRSREIKKKSRVMMEIARIARKIEQRAKKIRDGIKKKSVKSPEVVVDEKEHVRKLLLDALKKLRPGEALDLAEFSRKRGLDYDTVKKAAEEIVRVGELAVRLDRPILPFLGSWKLKRL